MSKANRQRRYRRRKQVRLFLKYHAESVARRPRQFISFAELEEVLKRDPLWRAVVEARRTYFAKILSSRAGFTIERKNEQG